MPFGYPYLFPTSPDTIPQDNYASEFENAMGPDLAASRAANTSNAAAIQDQYRLALQQVSGMAGPAPMPVPKAISPGLAGLAGFFSFLNQSQTGSNAAPAAVMDALSRHEAERAQATESNADMDRRFSLSKLEATERTHEQFLNLLRENAVDSNNLEAAYEHNKALYTLQEKKHKRDLQAAEDAKNRLASANSARILARAKVVQQDRAKTAADSLTNKIAYQKELVRLGLKADPSTLAKERTIRSQASTAERALLNEAQASMLTADDIEPRLQQIYDERDTAIQSLYDEARARLDEEGKVLPPAPAHKKASPVSVKAPNGKTYTFPDQESADKFKARAGIK